MKYLFFDIECANCFGGTGKICEFGYVLTDDKFVVLQEESWKMNPRASFDKKGFAIRGIEFDKPYEYYSTQPDFTVFYDKIAQLLRRPNQKIFGHGVASDAQFLLDECRRYKKQPINFEFFDTKKLAMLIFDRQKNLKLQDLYNDFCGEEEQHHRALEDAHMTKEVAKYYEKHLNMPLYKVLTNYSLASGESFLGRIVQGDTTLFGYAKNNSLNSRAKEIVKEFIEEDMAYNSNVTYVLPSAYEKTHFKEVMVILNRLKEREELFSFMLSRNAIYVEIGEEKDYKLKRYEEYLEGKGVAPTFLKISFDEFLARIGLTHDDLRIDESKLNDILGDMRRNRKWYEAYKKVHSVFYKINDAIQNEEFECSMDFPVIQYKAKVEIESPNGIKECEGMVFYDYLLDAFFGWHPYRVNRAANSYLSDDFFKKTIKRSKEQAVFEIARNFKLAQGSKIRSIRVYESYPYITSYKFMGEFDGDTLKFKYPNAILADEDFKGAEKLTGYFGEVNIERAIKELYDEKYLTIALCHMAKFKFRYKDKNFVEPKIVNKKYQDGDKIYLPKEYYLKYQEGTLDETYLPSTIEFKTDLFKKPIRLPVLIKR